MRHDNPLLASWSGPHGVPPFAKIKIEGMTGDDDLSGMLESFGIPKAPVDLALDYRLNPTDKVLTVSKLEVGLQGQGSLSLSLVLDGVSDKASEAAGAKDTASLRSLRWSTPMSGCCRSSCPPSPSSRAWRPTR